MRCLGPFPLTANISTAWFLHLENDLSMPQAVLHFHAYR